MTAHQFIGTLVRLFAIWLSINSIAYLSAIPASLAATSSGNGSSVSISYTLGGAYILVALLLWFFPMAVAQKIIPRTQHTSNLSFNAQELARVGCAMLGLWLVSKTLPSLVWLLFRAFFFTEVGTSSFSTLPPETKLDIAVSFFELAFAIAVIAKARAFANIVSPNAK